MSLKEINAKIIGKEGIKLKLQTACEESNLKDHVLILPNSE